MFTKEKVKDLHYSLNGKISADDLKNAEIEIEKTALAADAVNESTLTTETRQYDIVSHLVTVIKDMAVIEKEFAKEPSLVNVNNSLVFSDTVDKSSLAIISLMASY